MVPLVNSLLWAIWKLLGWVEREGGRISWQISGTGAGIHEQWLSRFFLLGLCSKKGQHKGCAESATNQHSRQGIYRSTLSVIGCRLVDKIGLVSLSLSSSSSLLTMLHFRWKKNSGIVGLSLSASRLWQKREASTLLLLLSQWRLWGSDLLRRVSFVWASHLVCDVFYNAFGCRLLGVGCWCWLSVVFVGGSWLLLVVGCRLFSGAAISGCRLSAAVRCSLIVCVGCCSVFPLLVPTSGHRWQNG